MPPFFAPRALFLNCLLLFIAANPVPSQQELPELDVSGRPWGEDIVGPYDQPRWSARGRFSTDTDVYVLPPNGASGKNFSDTGEQEGDSQGPGRVSDSYELRLLLGQEIGKLIEFAGNIFFEQAVSGTRERDMGFSTAWSYALRGEALKVGVETSYSNESEHGARSKAKNIFEIGPSFTVKPSPHTRVDLAPLLGATKKSPAAEVFMIFSIGFGTGAASETEGPVSARFR